MRSVDALELLPLLCLRLRELDVMRNCLKAPVSYPQKLQNPLHLVLSHYYEVALKWSNSHHAQVEVSKAQQLSAQLIEDTITGGDWCANGSQLSLPDGLPDSERLHLFIFQNQEQSLSRSASWDNTIEEVLIAQMNETVRYLGSACLDRDIPLGTAQRLG